MIDNEDSSSDNHNSTELSACSLALQSLDASFVNTENSTWNRNDVYNRIVELLSTQPEKLMNVLYRIDVDEEKISNIFQTTPLPSIAHDICSLIIERMEQKLITRARYKSPS